MRRVSAGSGIGSAPLTEQFCDQTTSLTWDQSSGNLAVDSGTTDGYSDGYTDFIYGSDGLPVEQVYFASGSTTGTPDWYYQDLEGNTRALLDASGNIDQTYNYSDWGAETPAAADEGQGTPLLYDGLFTDSVSALSFDGSSWYDPSTGQYLSQDPDVSDSLLPYAFASDDPAEPDKKPEPETPRCRFPRGKFSATWCQRGRIRDHRRWQYWISKLERHQDTQKIQGGRWHYSIHFDEAPKYARRTR